MAAIADRQDGYDRVSISIWPNLVSIVKLVINARGAG